MACYLTGAILAAQRQKPARIFGMVTGKRRGS